MLLGIVLGSMGLALVVIAILSGRKPKSLPLPFEVPAVVNFPKMEHAETVVARLESEGRIYQTDSTVSFYDPIFDSKPKKKKAPSKKKVSKKSTKNKKR